MTSVTGATYYDQAIGLMRSNPRNNNGTIGFTVGPGMKEWEPWLAYFEGKGWRSRASHMRTRGLRGYMVPCRSPSEFDPDIAEVRAEYANLVQTGKIRAPDRSRRAGELTEAERTSLADRLTGMIGSTTPKRPRKPAVDLEPKPLTAAEAESLRRVSRRPWLGWKDMQPTQDEEYSL